MSALRINNTSFLKATIFSSFACVLFIVCFAIITGPDSIRISCMLFSGFMFLQVLYYLRVSDLHLDNDDLFVRYMFIEHRYPISNLVIDDIDIAKRGSIFHVYAIAHRFNVNYTKDNYNTIKKILERGGSAVSIEELERMVKSSWKSLK